MLLWRRQVPGEIRELVNRLVSEVVRPILERSWSGGGKEMAEKVSLRQWDIEADDDRC
jgi:GC-rich sequence DNA-binding factor